MTTAELARLRQGVYRVLGAGFAVPGPADHQVIATIPVLSDLGLFDYAFALPLVNYVEARSEADASELTAAYMAMFEVGVGGAVCPPTESAWLADSRSGEVAVVHGALRRAYFRFGLDPGGPVDHVATEFEVMAALCGEEADRIGSSRAAGLIQGFQREMLNDHMGRWIPTFVVCIQRVDRHPVYNELARAVHAFLEHDRELLALVQAVAGEGAT